MNPRALVGPDGRVLGASPEARFARMKDEILRRLERTMFLDNGGRIVVPGHPPPPTFSGLAALLGVE